MQTLATEFNQTSKTSNSITECFDKIYKNLLANFVRSGKYPTAI